MCLFHFHLQDILIKRKLMNLWQIFILAKACKNKFTLGRNLKPSAIIPCFELQPSLQCLGARSATIKANAMIHHTHLPKVGFLEKKKTIFSPLMSFISLGLIKLWFLCNTIYPLCIICSFPILPFWLSKTKRYLVKFAFFLNFHLFLVFQSDRQPVSGWI